MINHFHTQSIYFVRVYRNILYIQESSSARYVVFSYDELINNSSSVIVVKFFLFFFYLVWYKTRFGWNKNKIFSRKVLGLMEYILLYKRIKNCMTNTRKMMHYGKIANNRKIFIYTCIIKEKHFIFPDKDSFNFSNQHQI